MRVALGLGASLGDRRARLELTARQLHVRPGLTLLRASRLYRTPPMRGGRAHGWFLNAVLLLDCAVPLEELLAHCRALESRAGRRRALHWGDRPLDLDLLVAEGERREGPDLVLPHPGIPRRAFVLVPLLEVWPDAVDPDSGRPYRDFPDPPGPRPVPVGVLAAGVAAA